jgi:DNA-binding transcriptional ArsR family regulator
MKGNAYRRAAKLFHLLSHTGRLRILDELRCGEVCVCHLQAVLRRPQPYVSQQLRVLRDAGIVASRKDGLNVYYCLADPQAERLLAELLGPAGGLTHLQTCPCPACGEVARAEARPASGLS